MSTQETSDVRRIVERFLAKEITLRELSLWLGQEGWSLREGPPDSPALDAIRSLDLHLAEFTSNLCSREELANRFRTVINETETPPPSSAPPLSTELRQVGPSREVASWG